MDDEMVLELLRAAAAAVRRALDGVDDWGPSGRVGQYRSDLVADGAALDVLGPAGVSVLSEESGLHEGRGRWRDVLVVVDPLDGSTNAARGVPWYATSLCALDAAGPRVALVVDQAGGTAFEAVRGGGARRDGAPIGPSRCTRLDDAVVGLAGLPETHLGWRQFRALGAAALDLCLVASGVLDAYADCSTGAHGPWDYLGGTLVCHEAGAVTGERAGRDLVVTGHGDRRSPLAAATPELLAELTAAVRGTAPGSSPDGEVRP